MISIKRQSPSEKDQPRVESPTTLSSPPRKTSSSEDKNDIKLQLGYWPFAGRNMPVTYIMEILQIPYTQVVFDQHSWFGKDRDALELNFPNLPYLIDESADIKITEVHNIVNYLLFKSKRAKDFSLLINNGDSSVFSAKQKQKQSAFSSESTYSPIDDFKIDEIRFILNDVFTQISSAIAKSPIENQIKHMQDTVIPKMNMLRAFVEQKNAATVSRTSYFIMGYLSVADAYFYIISKYFERYFTTLYEPFAPVFDLLTESFEAIPQINTYINSERYPRFG